VSSEFNNIKELYKLFVQFPFICTDTRKIVPNCLFFCLKGENFDGNSFVDEALEKGAKYVITERRGKTKNRKYIIVVDDVLATFQQLALFHRNQLNIPVIGITGTNGKTTTKELIVSVLLKKYKTAYTKGNFNNHIGVPLSILSIKKDDEIAVIEMGANHPGEIAELCEIAQPDYGLITNIGKAHLEGFGTIENIIETKTALYRAAKVLFVNGEDEILRCAVSSMRCAEGGKENSYTLSLLRSYALYFYGNNTDISGIILEMTPCLVINLFNKKIETRLTGNYNLPNILAAAAIGDYFKVSKEDICDAIAEYTPQNQRSQIIKNKDNTIIADYYNANPTSVKAALDSFLQIDAPNKLAILGDMLELGENSIPEHQAIIDFCEASKIDTFFIGDVFYSLKNERSHFFRNVQDFNNFQKSLSNIDELPKGRSSLYKKLILLKGSRGIHLEDIIELS
jgi:UDP-N-acetylmuramoyl-tripeptide--D-alanyl-D-alanine ligase